MKKSLKQRRDDRRYALRAELLFAKLLGASQPAEPLEQLEPLEPVEPAEPVEPVEPVEFDRYTQKRPSLRQKRQVRMGATERLVPNKINEKDHYLRVIDSKDEKSLRKYHSGPTKGLTLEQVKNNLRKEIIYQYTPSLHRVYRESMLEAALELFVAHGLEHYAAFCRRALAAGTSFYMDEELKVDCLALGEVPKPFTFKSRDLGLSFTDVRNQFLVENDLAPEVVAPKVKRRKKLKTQ